MADTSHSESLVDRARTAYKTITDILALAGPFVVVGMIRLAHELEERFE
jgi:hypothetical protein